MSLKDKIVADMTQAMRDKEATKLSTLRMAKAAVMNEENKRGVGTVLTDDEVTKILTMLVKQRKDSIEQFTDERTRRTCRKGTSRTRRSRRIPAASRFRTRNRGGSRTSNQRNRREFDEGNGFGNENRARQTCRQNRRRQIGQRNR